MKKILLLFLVLFLVACGSENAPTNTDSSESVSPEVNSENSNPDNTAGDSKAEYQKISPEQAKEMMDNQSVIIVDVRTEAEYKGGHIPNALLIPNETIGDENPAELSDQDATILIYCRSGNRSQQAAHKLIELGYQNVYDFGGINQWTYDIEK